MDLDAFRFLSSSRGQQLLSRAAERPLTDETLLADLTHLRRVAAPQEAAAAVEMTRLRRRAAVKFERAEQMFFTRPALEQASGEVVSAHRGQRFRRAGLSRVGDLGCGIGGDSLGLAAFADVVGLDRDCLRLQMARANLAAYQRAERFQAVQADLRDWLPTGLEALFFDPGRRTRSGRRLTSTARYEPPLELIDRWLPRVTNVAVKVSPGIDYAELPPAAEVEFVSEAGVVKEAVLWFGELRTGAMRRATLLPGGVTLTDEEVDPIPVTQPKGYLYEPDGAVIRAHLVEQLAARLGANKLDPEIAYLTADGLTETPLARAYRIESWMPFNLKKLRAALRARNMGRLVVKKRGSPIEPETLIQRLDLRGPGSCTVILTKNQGRPVALIGHPVQEAHHGG